MNISVMIFTLNEEMHLPLCLDSLQWCDDIIVIDSFSIDQTEAVARRAGARFFQNRFAGFGSQRNWAFSNVETRHPWVLVLDADEKVTPELATELQQAVETVAEDVAAFRLCRRFYMWGKWLKYSSLYPTWVVRLVRPDRVRYVDRGHAETQHVEGRIVSLRHDLVDENLRGIDAWFERQNRYSRADAEYEYRNIPSGNPLASIISADPLQRRAGIKRIASVLPFRGLWFFLYCYLIRRGFLDGREGFVFCSMKAMHQRMIAIKKYDISKRENTGVVGR